MPDEDEQQQEQEAEESYGEIGASIQPSGPVTFPWLAFFAAAFLDLIGMVPIINFVSEPLAKLAFGLWQKAYAPKTNPFLTAIITLIADGLFLGFLPGNIATVIFAYIKKKVEEKKEALLKLSKTRLGKYALNKFSQQSV